MRPLIILFLAVLVAFLFARFADDSPPVEAPPSETDPVDTSDPAPAVEEETPPVVEEEEPDEGVLAGRNACRHVRLRRKPNTCELIFA